MTTRSLPTLLALTLLATTSRAADAPAAAAGKWIISVPSAMSPETVTPQTRCGAAYEATDGIDIALQTVNGHLIFAVVRRDLQMHETLPATAVLTAGGRRVELPLLKPKAGLLIVPLTTRSDPGQQVPGMLGTGFYVAVAGPDGRPFVTEQLPPIAPEDGIAFSACVELVGKAIARLHPPNVDPQSPQ